MDKCCPTIMLPDIGKSLLSLAYRIHGGSQHPYQRKVVSPYLPSCLMWSNPRIAVPYNMTGFSLIGCIKP